jgi:hypothetical protein
MRKDSQSENTQSAIADDRRLLIAVSSNATLISQFLGNYQPEEVDKTGLRAYDQENQCPQGDVSRR